MENSIGRVLARLRPTRWPERLEKPDDPADGAVTVDLTQVRRALSVRQPYAEQIMRGTKQVEYRTQPTKIRERVYIYASLTAAEEDQFWRMKAKPGDFPVGVLIGTVEIVDCVGRPGDYEWRLARPARVAQPIKPTRKAQPTWFFPFSA